MEKVPATVDVDIFGSTYHVRGESETGHLRELADLVDRRMRDIAAHLRGADTVKVAILAALNLADELQRAEKQLEGERVKVQEKAEELSGELASALGR